MALFRFNKRSEERYPVNWESELQVHFSDQHYQIPVIVANISTQGALLLSDQIFIDNQPIISNHQQNQLILVIQTEVIVFQSPIEVRWYQWSVRKNRYEIGIKFIVNQQDIHKKQIDEVIRFLRQLKNIQADSI